MKKIEKYLSEWTGKEFISSDQQQQILQYEESKTKVSRSKWVLYGFLILGVCVLGIGMISLIAANWEEIPPSIKLTGNFIILAGAAFAVIRQDQKSNDVLFDAAGAFFAMLCLATIGLISQVFHTGGELYQALLFWLVIILPLCIFSKKDFLPHLWVAVFLIMFLLWSTSESSWWHSQESYFDENNFFIILLTIPLLCFFLSNAMNGIEWLVRFRKIFNQWAVVATIVAIGTTDFYYSIVQVNFETRALIPVYLFVLLCTALLYIRSDFSIKERIIITLIIAIMLFAYLPDFILSHPDINETGELFGASYSIIQLILFSMFFTIRNSKRLFNVIILLIGLRFIIVYFQVFGDLAITGFGLIISGMLIIGISLLWFKKREKLETWLGDILR